MIQLQTPNINNRIQYITEILSERWGIQVVPSEEKDDQENAAIFYTEKLNDSQVCIPYSGFLEEGENDVHFNWKDGVLFINNTEDDLASIFFLLTCTETYINDQRDEHGRFLGKFSELPTEFYLTPYVDVLLEKLKQELIKKTDLKDTDFKKTTFKIQPTFDIDVAWAYGHRSSLRTFASKTKDIFKSNKSRISERKNVLKGQQEDPYNTYSTIEKIANKHDVHTFFLLGKYGRFDKNISPKDPDLRDLIQRLDKKTKVGIHPSYQSKSEIQLKKEIDTLKAITDEEVKHSRQHYLRLDIPQTYRKLASSGIEHDFSMGFADIPGFRAGTSIPYPFYDLEKEEILPITVHPFAYMDGTLNEYMQLSPKEAIKIVSELKSVVQKYDGIFSFIWHNDTINDEGKWKGWKSVFDASFD